MSDSEPRLWWQTAVVYQIYPRSFRDADGDGVGDLAGILEKVDYLSETLGVDAVWISPFYPSPMADFGYDVSDYRAVHPLFGDLETFDRLLARIHEAGLRLIVDFVPNHSSDRHPWFVESRASRDDPKRDWYVWRDPRPDGSPPTNWLSVFGGSVWELDARTGQYYLHSFLKEQPDLNWRNPEVREAMLDAMRFWLDRGVDGFRIDAPLFMMKDPEERDNPRNPGTWGFAHKSMGAYDSQVHLYDQGHEDIHEVFREMRAVLDAYEPPRMGLGEIHKFDPVELAKYYGEGLDGLSMPANFGLLKAPWTAAGLRETIDALHEAIPDGAWLNWVLGTHDDRRLASRLGEPASRQAAVLLLTLRGSPTLYYGDEIGMREAEIPPERQRDPWGRTEPGLGRDGCRTPMQWSSEEGAGFTSGPDTWLPLGADWKQRNVASQLGDPASLLELYRRLLGLRRRSPALLRGVYRSLDPGCSDVFLYERATATERAHVAINLSHEPRSAGADIAGRVAISTHHAREGEQVAGTLELAPYEAAVVIGGITTT